MTNICIGLDQGLACLTVNGAATAKLTLKAGPVQKIAVDPLAPELVYAATLEHGLFRSGDGGASWERAGGGITAPLTWCVAVSRSERVNGAGVVYAGTEPSALYRSEDRGASFQALPAFEEIPSRSEWSFPPAPDTHHVESIALDPGDPRTVLVGVELGGVFLSVDGGASWQACPGADPDPHMLLTHPDAPHRFYEGGGSSYCESVDGGATWRRVVDGIPDEVRYFYSAAVDPGDPEIVVLSAARDPFSGHAVPIPGFGDVWSTLYRRVGSGSWEEVTDGLPERDGTAMGALATNAAEPGVFYYVTIPGELYRSQDAGASWSPVETTWPADLDKRSVRVAAAGEGR